MTNTVIAVVSAFLAIPQYYNFLGIAILVVLVLALHKLGPKGHKKK